MKNTLNKVREWPQHHRRMLAAVLALGCTGLLGAGWVIANPLGLSKNSIVVSDDAFFPNQNLIRDESRARQDSYAAALESLFPGSVSGTTTGNSVQPSQSASGYSNTDSGNNTDYFEFTGMKPRQEGTGGSARDNSNVAVPIGE